MGETQGNEVAREKVSKPEFRDAVDALEAFIEKECEVIFGIGVFVKKSEFEERFCDFCKQRGVEPPSRGMLGTILVNLWAPIWADTIRMDGGNIPVWRNLAFKEVNHGAEGGASLDR